MEAFFFSVETFTTIGYGNIIPANFAANVLVTIDAFVGSLGFALATGLLFARFSRPTAKLVFSEKGLIAPYRGITAFEFRIANQRPSQLIDVDAKVLLSRMEEVNGTRMRRFYNLPLERERVVFFPLAWTVVHPIDEESPLNGLTPEDLRETQSEFLVLITAIDDTFSQTVHSRTSYRYDEVKWRHKFRDLFTSDRDGDGIHRNDLRRLHDIEEVEI
jgi:inward rectifier potassium channel